MTPRRFEAGGMSCYTFGDTERAARRLALVARVFEGASAGFVAECGRPSGASPAAVALDLGCGPGYTTEMLARALGASRTLGMDASQAYVDTARSRAPGCAFVRHDVLATPWPVPPPEVAYARFLLSHLCDVDAAVARFASQLAPGGRLLLDEVEWIRSEAPVFRRYLELVEAVLASQGQCLFVGARLAALAVRHPRTRHDAVRELEVDARDAAGMFALNWETLREHPAVASHTDAAEREALAEALAALRDGAATARITWGLRQVALGA